MIRACRAARERVGFRRGHRGGEVGLGQKQPRMAGAQMSERIGGDFGGDRGGRNGQGQQGKEKAHVDGENGAASGARASAGKGAGESLAASATGWLTLRGPEV